MDWIKNIWNDTKNQESFVGSSVNGTSPSMDWIKNTWNYIKNPEPFVGWVNATFPATAGSKYIANVYYILISIAGLILLYIAFKILRWAFRKLRQIFVKVKAYFLKKKKKTLPKDAEATNVRSKLSDWLKWLREKLNPEKEPMEEAFYEASKLLKQSFGGNDYMYELPWYLTIGDTGSGKSTLLESLDIKRPFGLGPKIENLGLPLTWGYFDYGVVLDVRGDVIYENNKKEASSKVWSDLLQQLSYHRARRPLDGIIVTLSAKDLYGSAKLSAPDIRKKAQVLYQKLIAIQNNLSMRLPVYVVVTKTDILPGFNAFAKSFRTPNLKNIFGWSSPHGIQQPYNPSWMEDASRETLTAVNDLKLQAFAMMHKQEKNLDEDALFVFSEELSKVWDNITIFCNQLFSENVYKDSHFLRGIYFTGNIEESKNYTANIGQFVQRPSFKMCFVRDLFMEKIFAERNIGFPSYEIIQSVWRNFTVGKIGLLGGFAASCLLSLVSYYQFRGSKENLTPAIQDIKTVMKEIKNLRDNNFNPSKDELETYNKHLDHFLKVVTEETKFWAFFMPPSWFSSFKKDAYSAVGTAFDLILVQSVHQQVREKLNKLLATPKEISKLSEKEKTVFDAVDQKLSEKANPIKTKYFQQLKEFVDSLVLLEQIANGYNNFFISRNEDDLFALIKDLFNYEFTDEFKSNFSFYSRAIRSDAYEKLDLKTYKKLIQKNLSKLFDGFLAYGITQNDSLKKVFGLNSILDELADVDSYGDISADDFENIFKTIQDVIDLSYKTGDLAWIAEGKFNPGEDYQNFLIALSRSKLIAKEFVDGQMSRIQKAYSKLKDEISGSYSSMLDASVFNMSGGVFHANQELIDIKNSLDTFVDESFMVKVEKKGLATQEINGKLILWDARHLANADKILSSYYDFIEKGIEDYPQKLRPLLEKVSKAQLHKNLLNLLGASQYTISSNIEVIGTNPEERFKNQVRCFMATWAPLKKILTELSSVDEIPEPVTELNRFVAEQFLKVLTALDSIIDTENLLKVRKDKFKWWSGDGDPILSGFKVTDSKALEGLLDTHFRRLSKLAKDYAKPSVNLLVADFFPLQTSEQQTVKRWASILEQALAYEKKQAGNSIEKLVQLYMQDLKEFKIETAAQTLAKIQAISDESDYFLEQRSLTLKDLSDRVDAISGYKLLEQYQKVSDYFNENIANKYPFTSDPSVQEEVDLASLKELFNLMGEKSFSIDDYATAFKARESSPDRYIDFYKNLDILRRLFKPFADGKTDVPSISLQIYFHASKHRESSTAQYLQDQEFDFGMGVPFDIIDNGKKVVWNYGDPVNVGFKLADGAPISMFTYSQDETSFNKVSDVEGVFSYDGEWALFKMLADKADKREKGILAFDIPIQTDRGASNMRTFIKVTLQNTDEKEPVTLPEFPKLPEKAPRLSKKTRKVINSLQLTAPPKKSDQDSAQDDEDE
jgi:type VI secretion system protein ImpL